MRTPEEIIDHYESLKLSDFLGTYAADLLTQLDFEHAKPYLQDDATEADWNAEDHTEDDETVKARIVDYLDFAWGKAHDERGISAGRSIDHFKAWLWLIGDDELLAFASDDDNYPQYGMPILRKITEKYAPDKLAEHDSNS